jgi:hypothetical protein
MGDNQRPHSCEQWCRIVTGERHPFAAPAASFSHPSTHSSLSDRRYEMHEQPSG